MNLVQQRNLSPTWDFRSNFNPTRNDTPTRVQEYSKVQPTPSTRKNSWQVCKFGIQLQLCFNGKKLTSRNSDLGLQLRLEEEASNSLEFKIPFRLKHRFNNGKELPKEVQPDSKPQNSNVTENYSKFLRRQDPISTFFCSSLKESGNKVILTREENSFPRNNVRIIPNRV